MACRWVSTFAHVCEQWEALSRKHCVCTFLPWSFPATTSMLPLARPAQGVESHREQLFQPFAIHSHLSPPALEPAAVCRALGGV